MPLTSGSELYCNIPTTAPNSIAGAVVGIHMDTYASTLIATDEPFVSIIVPATVHYFNLTVWRISLDGFYIAGEFACTRGVECVQRARGLLNFR